MGPGSNSPCRPGARLLAGPVPHAPALAAAGRYHVVYNGEVYNFVELRRDLEAKGYPFATHSDTEVLLACYAVHGLDALGMIDGMFAFALWDAQERELLLARDRVGIKPLFYARLGEELAFASELKSLLKHPGVGRELSGLAVSQFFSRG